MPTHIFHNGHILSFHNGVSRSEAIAIRADKILAAGTTREIFSLKKNDTQIIDLQGKTLLPGFHDAHVHVWKIGNLLTQMLDLRGVGSIPEMQRRLADFRKKNPHLSWLNARGFNEISMAERRLPTAADLDAAVPDIPVFVQRTCAHIAVVNSKTLEISNLKNETPDPPGGQIDRDPAGNPIGVLRETAQGLAQKAFPQPTAAELRTMILAAQDALLARGITTATDPAITPDLYEVYRSMAAAGDLKMRIHAFPILLPDGGTEPLPLPEKIRTPFFTADTVKFFADGGLSGRTAALSRPYRDGGGTGILRLDETQFFELASEAAAAGWGIATHAIGDRAIDLVLKIFKKIRGRFPAARLRIEHLGLPTRKHLNELKINKIGVATQPVFLDELGENFVSYLDSFFLKKTYPVRSLLERDIPTAFSSDAPVVRDFNPLKSVACAVHRRTAGGKIIAPDEAVRIEDGLRAFTAGAAQLSGRSDSAGALLPGFDADFVILKKNPLGVVPENLPEIEAVETWVAGRMVGS